MKNRWATREAKDNDEKPGNEGKEAESTTSCPESTSCGGDDEPVDTTGGKPSYPVRGN